MKKNRSLVQITRFERIASIQSSTEQRKASIADIIDEVISFSNSGKNLEKNFRTPGIFAFTSMRSLEETVKQAELEKREFCTHGDQRAA
ncbi:hypothetical protein NXY25_04305 [Bacteroides thetaiotaomicron]|nr:hypothetical protein [Bacteroides thetaiotaomicron]